MIKLVRSKEYLFHLFSNFSSKVTLLFILIIIACKGADAQTNTTINAPKKDTSMDKTNTTKWRDEDARVYYEQLNTAKIFYPDTALHTFQRRPFLQPWYNDLGNIGSPVMNLMFTPEAGIGPSLGYHIFDVYRFDADNLNFYNTNRPYSVFSYQLGSKLEQMVSLMHSQNVKPNWNVTFEYRKINSPGYYKIQRTNHDNAYLSTNYKSLDKHYTLYAAIAYNKEQHDENGGIVDATELQNAAYTDRKTIDVAYQNVNYSITRSTVTNMQRDFTLLLQHGYTWGNSDTTYNADSTGYQYKLIPRFSITHTFEISSQKHEYKDLAPDSLRYITLFHQSFANSGSGYYTQGEDSVETQQNWIWVENKLMLNWFIGKEGRQLKFSAGLGNRFDEFISKPVSNIIRDSLPDSVYSIALDRTTYISNYLAGDIKKEALRPGEWEYGANAKLYLTGQYAGDLMLNALVGKQLGNNNGSIVAGASEQLGSAPYSYTNYENRFVKLFFDFNRQSVSSFYFSIDSRKIRLSGGIKTFLINNYIYINDSERPAQYNVPFSINEVWIRKIFKAGNWYLDNELVYQQVPTNAPVNVPELMGRHQLSYEKDMFHRALKVATGVEMHYTTSYHPAGYDALLNRFFYQNSTYVGNMPEFSVFLNFRVKHFRAYIMVDQLQQFTSTNSINFIGTSVVNFNGTGSNYTPVYAAQNTMIRFGFTWALVN